MLLVLFSTKIKTRINIKNTHFSFTKLYSQFLDQHKNLYSFIFFSNFDLRLNLLFIYFSFKLTTVVWQKSLCLLLLIIRSTSTISYFNFKVVIIKYISDLFPTFRSTSKLLPRSDLSTPMQEMNNQAAVLEGKVTRLKKEKRRLEREKNGGKNSNGGSSESWF